MESQHQLWPVVSYTCPWKNVVTHGESAPTLTSCELHIFVAVTQTSENGSRGISLREHIVAQDEEQLDTCARTFVFMCMVQTGFAWAYFVFLMALLFVEELQLPSCCERRWVPAPQCGRSTFCRGNEYWVACCILWFLDRLGMPCLDASVCAKARWTCYCAEEVCDICCCFFEHACE